MNRLRQVREDNNETQSELAKSLRVASAAVSNWEQGIRQMDYETLIAVSRRYNVTVDYLLCVDTDLGGLSADEARIIGKYRNLNIAARGIIEAIMDVLRERMF